MPKWPPLIIHNPKHPIRQERNLVADSEIFRPQGIGAQDFRVKEVAKKEVNSRHFYARFLNVNAVVFLIRTIDFSTCEYHPTTSKGRIYLFPLLAQTHR